MVFKIGERFIGENERPYFIADIAANHDGDLGRAFKLIELAKEAGADCAKFQNFKADYIVSKSGFEAMGGQLSHQASWKKSVYDTYVDASVADEWSYRLKEKCDEVQIEYMTSPYDYDSVDHANQFVNAFKVGSGDITWLDIIGYMAKKGKPMLLATGASDLEDVDRAVDELRKCNSQIVLMQCNTNYTASSENYKYINLNVLKTYKERYSDIVLGLSDHTYGYAAVLGAYALGARVFEKHFTDDNDRIGPDHKFSMNPHTWKEMVGETMKLYEAMGDGVKRVEDNEQDTCIVQRRSLYYKESFPAGHVVGENDLIPLRPSPIGSLLPYEKNDVLGMSLQRNVEADTAVRKEDFMSC